MHSDLMKETVFHDLNHLYPGRITNKTNGITFRRWLMLANPRLTGLLREVCGEAVLDDFSLLERLEARASDNAFQQRFRDVKHHNKLALARLIGERLNVKVDPSALFDVQIKRIHEYKRQLLNIVETVALYQAIKDEPQRDWVPRVKIFAGKAAASYRYAKLIIKLINDVAEVVNNDPAIAGRLKVVFLADYNVSLAEVIIPAADLSEQISTAGMEASGTGNMKLALNGALTIGTLDGANIEIRDHVGAENIAIFGMEAGDVMVRRKQGLDATDVISRSPRLARAISAIESGEFSPDDPARFASIGHALRYLDHYMVCADFDSYYEAQRGIDARWQVVPAWTRASILNVARMPWFSSDRTIREYAEDIWNVPVRARGRAGAWGAARGARRVSASAKSITSGVIELTAIAAILHQRHCERSEAIHCSACGKMDCFAPLAMTVPRNPPRTSMLTKDPAPLRRRHKGHRRRQLLAGQDQPGLLGLCRPVRRRHRRHHPAGADRASGARRRSAGAHRQLLRADRGRRLRSRHSPGQGQPLVAALVRRDDARRRRGRDAGHRRVRRAPAVMVAPAGGISAGRAVRAGASLSASTKMTWAQSV